MSKQFILYDGRAHDDPDDAMVLDTASSEKEAKRISRQHEGEMALWYEYDVQGKNLLNGKPRYDL